MESFYSFFAEYRTLIIILATIVVLGGYFLRRRAARLKAARWLAKARSTIIHNRKNEGLPAIPHGHITIGDDFDTAHQVYVTNPARLLEELNKLNTGLAKLVGNGCKCGVDWKLTVPGYSGQATLPDCADLGDAVPNSAVTATITALSVGGLNSEGLTEGHITTLARNLARRAADDSTRRPGYTLDCRYIGAVLQQFDYGNRIVIRRGRNPAREDSHLAMNDADALLAELKAGTYRTAFITEEDRFGLPPEGRLTAIVMHGDTITVT